MKNNIELIEIQKDKQSITYKYDIQGEWIKYFKTENEFIISYPMDISNVPDSVLAVPFVSNFLPMVWLCNAEMKLKEIDSHFYEQLENLKSGYENMYPMLEFKGDVIVDSIIRNHVEHQDKTAVFFSGGGGCVHNAV